MFAFNYLFGKKKVALGELELGEVWLSGPSKARGYWMKEELTHEVFHSALADGGLGKSGDGYLRTGDYGFMYDKILYLKIILDWHRLVYSSDYLF